ncbi:hypothetical protein XENOCAPTIV_000296, partial [Xenoophorus captivus]
VMQLAGLEGQQVVLLLEDYQFVHPAFLEMVNSLLSSGIQQNLHIILIMDCSNSNFTINCESNPAFYRKCSVQWMEGCFLAKRGVREEIATFDARNITPEIRQSVEELLNRNKASFEPKWVLIFSQNAKRASAAAAPLAAWVKANVQYSFVLERIEPLEREQAGLLE